MKFQRTFKEFLRVFQESFKGVSRKIEGGFHRLLGWFKWGSRVFEKSWKTITGKFQGNLKGCSKEVFSVSKKFQGCCKKD